MYRDTSHATNLAIDLRFANRAEQLLDENQTSELLDNMISVCPDAIRERLQCSTKEFVHSVVQALISAESHLRSENNSPPPVD